MKTCTFRARYHWIGDLKAFDTAWPYDCVGSVALAALKAGE